MATTTTAPFVSQYSTLYANLLTVLSPLCDKNSTLCQDIISSFGSMNNQTRFTSLPPSQLQLQNRPPVILVNMAQVNRNVAFTSFQYAINNINYPTYVILYNQPSSGSTSTSNIITIIKFQSNPPPDSSDPICSIVYEDAGAMTFQCTTTGFIYNPSKSSLPWWAILLIVLGCLFALFIVILFIRHLRQNAVVNSTQI
jgi:hypothetical protein